MKFNTALVAVLVSLAISHAAPALRPSIDIEARSTYENLNIRAPARGGYQPLQDPNGKQTTVFGPAPPPPTDSTKKADQSGSGKASEQHQGKNTSSQTTQQTGQSGQDSTTSQTKDSGSKTKRRELADEDLYVRAGGYFN